jgi:hypothetical protein
LQDIIEDRWVGVEKLKIAMIRFGLLKRSRLAESGIDCEPIRVDDYTGKKMTFFHDPDGLPLELHE